MIFKKAGQRNPWTWVPSLYYAEGLPYILVTFLSGIMFKKMGISNTEITFYTGWLTLPWVIKPLWSPFVDIFKTKRFWLLSMQVLLGAGLVVIAVLIPLSNFFVYTLIIFFILAFISATHDIAIDGFYMIGLTKHDQALFIGIRSTFYRFAMITGQGLLVIFAGLIENKTGDIPLSWVITFFIAAGFFALFFVYHNFILPKPAEDRSIINIVSKKGVQSEFIRTFILFFKKKNIGVIFSFILLYRFGEAQLSRIAPLFLLDPVSKGGIGLSTELYGIIYGTVGLTALIIGGVLGGILASKHGLKYWLFPMLFAINIPDLAYVYLAFTQTQNIIIISSMVVIEQFGYGLGFTAFLLYLIYISEGDHKTSHYAIATGFMALGLMIPGIFSGWLQELLGYKHFFVWVCLATIPVFIIAKFIPLDPEFGKKQNSN
jgi:PAT family beta-lactamase induction signal transducer AmpG